jgi:hypothetical protein
MRCISSIRSTNQSRRKSGKGVVLIKLFLLTLSVWVPAAFSDSVRPVNKEFYDWIGVFEDEKQQLNTYQIRQSREFNDFIEFNISYANTLYLGMTKKGENEDFIYHLREVLGGPPEKVRYPKDGIVVITGCRFRSCDEKGFVWMDAKNKKEVFVIISYFFNSGIFRPNGIAVIYSNDFDGKDDFPQQFFEELNSWLSSEEIYNYDVRFIR